MSAPASVEEYHAWQRRLGGPVCKARLDVKGARARLEEVKR